MLSAVHKHVQQVLRFVASKALATDAGESREPDYQSLHSEVLKCVQQNFNFAISTRLTNYKADFGEHD